MSHFTRYKTGGLFGHTLAFDPVNVFGDGLGDDIQNERQEQGILLEDAQDANELNTFWETAVEEARKDPDWNFSNDDDNAPLF